MPLVRPIQQRFTSGEIDPAMLGRSDLQQYYSAAETLTNVLTTAQGGVKRCPGLAAHGPVLKQITRETSYVVSAPNGGTAANLVDENYSTLFSTTNGIGTTNPYVVAQLDLSSQKAIGKVELFSAYLSTGSSAEFFIQYSTNGSTWTNAGNALVLTATPRNYSRVVCVMARYVRLVRIGSTNLGAATVTVVDMQVWTEGDYSNVKLASFAFNNAQTYLLVFTHKNIAIYREKAHVIDLRFEELTSSDVPCVSITQSGDTAIIFNKNVVTKTLVRGEAHDIWSLTTVGFTAKPYYNFVPNESAPALTLTPSAPTGNVTLTASGGVFASTDVNQYVDGNGGLARIVSYVSATVVKAVVEIPFIDATAMAAGSWLLMRGYEPAWSATRGWPANGTFHEGRLVVGGSRDRPTTLWMSRSGDYFDFDLGQMLDDDAIEFTIRDEYNEIINVYSGRSLMVFTAAAEYIVVQNYGDPITPASVNLKRQTSIGSNTLLPVVEFEGGVLYTQRGGQSIQEFLYAQDVDGYINNFVSLLSSHLVKTPIDISLRRATSTDEGAYLMLVRSDGNAAIANILRSQQITSFVRRTTDGTFKACAAEDEIMWFAVSRDINGVGRYWLENLETGNLLDASVRLTSNLPTTVMTGLVHLEGKTVKVIMDDSLVQTSVVTGGQVTLSRAPVSSIEVGLDFTPVIKDLPVETVEAGLSLTGRKFNLSEVSVRLKDTANMVINGKTVQFRGFGPAGGGSPLDAPPPKFTGVKTMRGWRGYDDGGQLTITQNQPLPMHILSVTKEVRSN